jgi:hypothetical protein
MILQISDKSEQAKAFIEYAETLPFVKVVKDARKHPSLQLRKAIHEAENGETIKCESVQDMMEKLNA